MKLKPFLRKYKGIVISIAIMLIVSVLLSALFLRPAKDKITDPSGVTEADVTLNVPDIKAGDSTRSGSGNDPESQTGVMLDVDGKPNSSGNNSGNNGTGNSHGTGGSNEKSLQKPPSIEVDAEQDGVDRKDESPNPQPPLDGYERTSEGFEDVPVDTDKSIEAAQSGVGQLIGSNLEKAGYYTLFMNAGAPRQMVEDAVKNYAKTGNVTLNPSDYGLPAIVGYYNVRLPAKGANIGEAAKYISDYMTADKIFNDKVKTVFAEYKDGSISVYQKDGYFYVLFAVIDKGYVN